MRTRWLVSLLAAASVWLSGCGAAVERPGNRKLRALMRDAQNAFALPELDEAQADEEAFESEKGP